MLLLLGHVLDDQHLEVGPVFPDLLHRLDHAVEGVVVGVQIGCPSGAERIGGQRIVDVGDQCGEPVVLARREQAPDLLERSDAGERPEPLDGPEYVEQAVDGVAQSVDRAVLGPGQHQLSR